MRLCTRSQRARATRCRSMASRYSGPVRFSCQTLLLAYSLVARRRELSMGRDRCLDCTCVNGYRHLGDLHIGDGAAGQQHDDPGCQGDPGQGPCAAERGDFLGNRAEAPVEHRAMLINTEGKHRHLQLEGGVEHDRRGFRREEDEPRRHLKKKPDGGDWKRRARHAGTPRRRRSTWMSNARIAPTMSSGPQDVDQVGQRVEPRRVRAATPRLECSNAAMQPEMASGETPCSISEARPSCPPP